MKWIGVFLVTALFGCDRFLSLEGRVIESDESSFEVFESPHAFRKASDGETRISKAVFRLFEDDNSAEEFRRYGYYPYEGDDLNFNVSWITTSWGDRVWKKLIVESEVYETVVIPGEDVPLCAQHLVLIRMKRTK